MKAKSLALCAVIPLLAICLACSSQHTSADVSYKDQVQKALEQADLKDVTVTEERDKNTITLGGTSDSAKVNAENVARAAAGSRIVANEIMVQPVGAESEAKEMASNMDDGIESNYKVALIANGLDKQHIHFDAKNGVLTLTGTVKTAQQREDAQQLAQGVPNVRQVLNQIAVKR